MSFNTYNCSCAVSIQQRSPKHTSLQFQHLPTATRFYLINHRSKESLANYNQIWPTTSFPDGLQVKDFKGYKKLNKNKQENATEMYEVYKAWNIYYLTCLKNGLLASESNCGSL